MKILYILVIMLMTISVFGETDCELPKIEKNKIIELKKDAGCEIKLSSGDLVTCLLNAKNEAEQKLCHENNKKKPETNSFIIPTKKEKELKPVENTKKTNIKEIKKEETKKK